MRVRIIFILFFVLAMVQGKAAVIDVSVDTLAFGEVEVGYPVTATFTVTGYDLQDDINLSIDGGYNSYYEVTPETITPQDAAHGVVVKVKCKPFSEYFWKANVLLSSTDADDVVIPISVTPFYPAEMFINNQTEQFDAYVGQFVTHTGTIRFADAEVPHDPNTPVDRGNSSFTLDVGNNGFIDNAYSFTIEGADQMQFSVRFVKTSTITNICTVAISYAPNTLGAHQATLKVNCSRAGVPTVTIPLRGESTAVLGDMDNDGLIDINDVTKIIDGLLTGCEVDGRADLDCDGTFSISDVTVLINRLLSYR